MTNHPPLPHRRRTDHHRLTVREHHRPSTDSRRTARFRPEPHAITSLDQYYGNDSDTPGQQRLDTSLGQSAGDRCTPRRASAWPRCPHRPTGMVVNRRTGEMVTPQCRRLRCPSCIVPRAIGVGQAIALAQPNLWITLTEIGATWPDVQHGMKMFKQRLRRLGVAGHFAYNVEPSDGGRSNHAHLWWRGEDVERTTIQLAAESGRFGTYAEVGTAFSARAQYAHPTIEYGLKAILADRPASPPELWAAASDYLERNGGRLVHSTRGFWLDAAGNPTTLANATRAAHRTDPAAWLFQGNA